MARTGDNADMAKRSSRRRAGRPKVTPRDRRVATQLTVGPAGSGRRIPPPTGPSVGQVLVAALLVVLITVGAYLVGIVSVVVLVVVPFITVNLLIGWLLYRSTHDR